MKGGRSILSAAIGMVQKKKKRKRRGKAKKESKAKERKRKRKRKRKRQRRKGCCIQQTQARCLHDGARYFLFSSSLFHLFSLHFCRCFLHHANNSSIVAALRQLTVAHASPSLQAGLWSPG